MTTEMHFDFAPTARVRFKEKLLWTLVVGIFFFLVYGSANQISAITAPHPSFYWEWERKIPFVAEFIIPYMSSDVFFVIAFAVAPNREAIQKLGLRCALAIAISAIFFLALPLEFSFQRPEVAGWPKFLFDALSLDHPYNQFPSLHISLGFLVWRVVQDGVHVSMKWLIAGWFVLVVASTLLVYQHHAIDLIGGAAVVACVYWLIPDKKIYRVPLGFVTPRHLDMALRYLTIGAIATICAFNTGAWAILFGWIALSMLGVSAGYALGLNRFLMKTRRYHSLASWILFWPYLAGSWLNWLYWRTRVALMANVRPGLWIGARPRGRDWQKLADAGVRSVIDLAPELAATTPEGLDHHNAPLLDITIPSPAELDAVARKIEEQRHKGGVYVHCALGMSRSVLAVAAWMIRQGKTREEALTAIDKVRPERVRKPYISISLELYEEYLAKVSADAHD